MMQTPVQIASRGFTLPPWWRERILDKAEKLGEFHHRITACRVVVEEPPRHKRKGRPYTVRIDLELPRAFIVVDREPAPTLDEAVERAFDAAGRRLQDLARRLNHDVKHHERAPVGRVAALFPDGGYGFLETEDGREIYFHRNSVLGGGFSRLTPGSSVRFAEEKGEKGPQASTVSVVTLAPRPERRRRRRAAAGV